MKEIQAKIRLVQSVDRAVQILVTLAEHGQGLSLTELSGKMDLPPQTAQSLIKTLQAHGLVVQAGRGRPYFLGPRIHQLSRQWAGNQDRASLARPIVLALSETIGEYVLLAEFRGTYAFGLVEAKSDHPLSVSFESNSFVHLHDMATGKVLLAWLGEDQRAMVIQKLRALPGGPASDAACRRLEQELRVVHEQGFATNIKEDMGMGSVAVPVCTGDGVVAALGASAPLVRFDPSRREKIRRELMKAAEEIGRLWTGG